MHPQIVLLYNYLITFIYSNYKKNRQREKNNNFFFVVEIKMYDRKIEKKINLP